MVEEPEITYTGSINNAEITCTVRQRQETIKGRPYVSQLMQRLAWRGLSDSKRPDVEELTEHQSVQLPRSPRDASRVTLNRILCNQTRAFVPN
jgi:hypothetical protein